VKRTGFAFTGKGSSLLWLRFWTFLLMVLTFFIWTPWRICRLNRWYYENLWIDDRKLDFDGKGSELFPIWLAVFVLTMVTVFIYAPWGFCWIQRWTLSHVSFEDELDKPPGERTRLSFSGRGLSLLWLHIWTLLPISLTFGIWFPWAICRILGWEYENTYLNERQFQFSGRGAELFPMLLGIFALNILTIGFYRFWGECWIDRWIMRNMALSAEAGVRALPVAAPIVTAPLPPTGVIPEKAAPPKPKARPGTAVVPRSAVGAEAIPPGAPVSPTGKTPRAIPIPRDAKGPAATGAAGAASKPPRSVRPIPPPPKVTPSIGPRGTPPPRAPQHPSARRPAPGAGAVSPGAGVFGTCPGCGNNVRTGWARCAFCGQQLRSQLPVQHQVKPRVPGPGRRQPAYAPGRPGICRACGSRTEPDWVRCPFCGNQLEAAAAAGVAGSRAVGGYPGGMRAGASSIRLSIEEGSGAGGAYVIASEQTTLGRAPDNDVVIDDELVSAHHASIAYTQGVFVLNDHGSTNGTIVNGQEISSCQIVDGDVIEIGDTIFRVDYGR